MIEQEQFQTSSRVELCEAKSRARQTLSDAWESTIREDLFDNPWHRRLHAAIVGTKLRKKFITDEEGADLLLPRKLVKKPLEVERGRFYFLFGDIEAHGHIGICPGYALLTLQATAIKPREDEFQERVRNDY